MSEFTTIHLGQNAKSVEDSPSFQPFSMVRIIVGEDENGTQIVYEAGEPSGRVLEVTNPWGTQQMANDMLAKIKGYQYKPFTADGALINPAAELGDSVTVGNVYSVINSAETTFSPIMSSTISAYEGSTIEHEFPYEPKENREIERRVGGIKTSLIVGLGRIESEITDLDDNLSTRITQTENSITTEVNRATTAEGSLSSRITINAESITSEVNRATDAETALSSRITQTADNIRAEVFGGYADPWENNHRYKVDDIVQVTTTDASGNPIVTFYQCWDEHTSSDQTEPGIGRFWQAYWNVMANPPTAKSVVDVGIEGITLGYQASALDNSATITLNKNGIQMQAQTITMTNVVANEIDSNAIFSDGIQLDGQLSVRAKVNGIWKTVGGIGGASGTDGVVDTQGTILRSGYYRGEYNYVIATAPPYGGVRMQAGNYSLYVTSNGVYASDGTTTKNLLS